MANVDTMESSTSFGDGFMQPSSSFKGSESVCIETASDENILLKDLDSYWDDLSARLTVSRMVSDSVVRGMASAILQEAAENISVKEAEIAKLNARLHVYESDSVTSCKSWRVPGQLRPQSQVQSNYSANSTDNIRHLHSLRTIAEEHLEMLRTEIGNMRSSNNCKMGNSNHILARESDLDFLAMMDKGVDALGVLLETMCEHTGELILSLNDSVYEQQWQWEFEKEVDAIILHSFMGELWAVFEMNPCKENSLLDIQNQNHWKRFNELSTLRQELDSISKSILNTERESSFPHCSHETFEESDNTNRKTHRGWENNLVRDVHHMEESGFASVQKSNTYLPEVAGFSQMLCMSKEDIISYYKTEINKVKRQLESALHEKTEEIFRLKGELLKEKGSLQCRRGKNFEVLKKTFLEIIMKLDKILSETEKSSMVQVDHDRACVDKQRIDNLLLENQHLHDLIVDKRKEVKCLSSRVSDATTQMSNYSSTEANLLKKVKMFKWGIEDEKAVAFIRNQIEKCILKELFSDIKSHFNDFQLRNEMVGELYGILLREQSLDLEVENAKKLKQISSLSMLMDEKERALSLEVKKSEKLKQQIASLRALVDKKNQIASEAESKLGQQQEHFNRAFEELTLLKDQVYRQEILISDSREESKLLKVRLDEASDQIRQSEANVQGLTQKFMTVSKDLEEAEGKKTSLHEVIQEKESELFFITARSDEQMVQIKLVIVFLRELSESVVVFQSNVMDNIQRSNSRLGTLCCQFDSLARQADTLKRNELSYRKKFETRSFDLERAETEVDLLGDEVDALLDILRKIYIALDYYSPVLQHYNGVMETLRLVKKELRLTL